MSTESSNGLSTVVQIEALADQLSVIADEIHARVIKDIKAQSGGPFSDTEQAIARGLLEDEALLRQRADGLYADAATYVVKSLGQSQQQIVKLTADAAEKIRKISRIADITGLVGGLLLLAGAAASGQAAPIVAAIERVSKQMKQVAASAPNKTA
jgi:hypothetical protein